MTQKTILSSLMTNLKLSKSCWLTRKQFTKICYPRLNDSILENASLGILRRTSSSYAAHSSQTSLPGDALDFGNHGLVFKHKSTWELLRGLLVLHACGIESLVKHSYKLLRTGEKLLGSRILGKVISPFYWQFVAGDSEAEMAASAEKLRNIGINLMIAPMIETDVGEGYESGDQYIANMEKTLHLINVAGRHGKPPNIPICQTKHTAHIPADLLSRMSTVYEKMTVEERINAIKSISCMMSSPDRNPGLDQSLLELTDKDQKDFIKALPRFNNLGKQCLAMRVTLAVDAEYTYTNPAISLITLAMMNVFNHQRPVVWNTYQGLLKNTMSWLKHDLIIAESLGFKFGAKIVRGAYLDKERMLAKEQDYADPTNPTYQATSDNYDSLVRHLGERVFESRGGVNLMVASHNEASVRKAVNFLEESSVKPPPGSFVFGQVYGMAENISVPLAAAGYQVYKSIPYGNMDEVLPYLSRRASENRAVFKGVRRERNLLTQQLASRIGVSS